MLISTVEEEASNTFMGRLNTTMAPKYSITRGEDGVLLWDPPARSRDLANALSYHYPLEQTLLEKMQSATRDFLDSETIESNLAPWKPGKLPKNLVSVNSETLIRGGVNEESLMPQLSKNDTLPPQVAHGKDVFGIWDAKSGESVKIKGRKRGLSPTSRRRVSQNRGNICAAHRKAKTLCDPTLCRQNKLYPGAGVDSKRTKRADQGQQVHEYDLTIEESQISNIVSTGRIDDGHPQKGTEGSSFLSPDLSIIVKQPKGFELPPKSQDRYGINTTQTFEENATNISPLVDSSNESWEYEELVNGTEKLTRSPSNNFAIVSGRWQVQDCSELLPSNFATNIGVKSHTVPAEQSRTENTRELQKSLPYTEELFGNIRENINWTNDLATSDLPCLELDWPWEATDEKLTTFKNGSLSPIDLGYIRDWKHEGRASKPREVDYGKVAAALKKAQDMMNEIRLISDEMKLGMHYFNELLQEMSLRIQGIESTRRIRRASLEREDVSILE